MQFLFSKNFSKFSLNSWAVFIFWLLPFLAIVAASWLLPGFDRFGVQWHVLLISCLISAVLVLFDETFFIFLRRLISISLLRNVVLLFSIWLAVMGFIHGFISQSESLFSATMYLLMVPIGAFLACYFRGSCFFVLVPALLITMLVLLENILLTNYLFQGYSFNIVESSSSFPPRLFLNTRDGNFLGLVQYLLILLVFASDKVRTILSINRSRLSILAVATLCFLPFYNAWLTQGRALLLSALVSSLLSLLFGKSQDNYFYRQFGFASIVACFLSFFAVQVIRFQSSLSDLGRSAISGGVAPFFQFVDRADGGRFAIWRLWIDSGISNSLWWGHGLGQLPSVEHLPVMTPHNLAIQILADGGICTLLISMVIILMISMSASKNKFFQPLDFCILCPLIVYSNLGNILFWPSGVWSLSLLLMVYIWFKISPEESLVATTSAVGSLRSRLSVSPVTIFYTATLVVSVVLLSSEKYLSLWSVIPLQVTN